MFIRGNGRLAKEIRAKLAPDNDAFIAVATAYDNGIGTMTDDFGQFETLDLHVNHTQKELDDFLIEVERRRLYNLLFNSAFHTYTMYWYRDNTPTVWEIDDPLTKIMLKRMYMPTL
jgi:hypothetical protein